MFTKLRKWLFNICSVCEQPASCDVYGVRYCQKHLSVKLSRLVQENIDDFALMVLKGENGK